MNVPTRSIRARAAVIIPEIVVTTTAAASTAVVSWEGRASRRRECSGGSRAGLASGFSLPSGTR